MARPKSSLFDFAGFVVSVNNNLKIKRNREEQITTNDKLNNQNHMISNLSEQTSIISNKIDDIGELQYATATGVRDVLFSLTQTLSGLENIHAELEILSKGSWEMMNFLQKIEKREEVLGTLRIFLIDVEEEVEKISLLSKDFLVFSLLMAEDLKSLFDSKNVSISHFKRMPSIDDLKWAKKVIQSVNELYISLGEKVTRDGLTTETYSKFKRSLINIPKLEQEHDTLIDKLKRLKSLPSQSKPNPKLVRLKSRMESLVSSKSKFTEVDLKFIKLNKKLDYEIATLKRTYQVSIEGARKDPWDLEFQEDSTDYVNTAKLINKVEKLEIDLSKKIQEFEDERETAKSEVSKLSKDITDIPDLAIKISKIESKDAKKLEEILSIKALIPKLETEILQLEQKISVKWDFIRDLLPSADSYGSDLLAEKLNFFKSS